MFCKSASGGISIASHWVTPSRGVGHCSRSFHDSGPLNGTRQVAHNGQSVTTNLLAFMKQKVNKVVDKGTETGYNNRIATNNRIQNVSFVNSP
jgi:hypothetical protein